MASAHRSARTKAVRPWLGAALAAGAATAMVVVVGAATAATSGPVAARALAAPTTPATVSWSVTQRTVVSPGESAATAPGSLPADPLSQLVPQLPMPQVQLGPVSPILGLPISYMDDGARPDETGAEIYNSALTNDEDKNVDSSEDYRDYDESSDDNGDNEGNDDADNNDADNNDADDNDFSKDYNKDDNKDDGGDDNGGNADNNSGPSPQVSNAPVAGVEAGDGTTSPAGYLIGALALAGMGGAAAVTARRSSRRRMGRHEA